MSIACPESFQISLEQASRLRGVGDAMQNHHTLAVLFAIVFVAGKIRESPHVADCLCSTGMHRDDATQHVTHRLKFQDVVPEPLHLDGATLP